MPSLTLPESPAVLLDRVRAEIRRREADAERARIAQDAQRIRDRCQTLAGFAREAWPILEPETPLKWGWHLDAIAEHLEAVTWGQINRLLINVPPGMSKSMMCSVLWQAWEWGPCGMPGKRFLSTSFAQEAVKRDTRKTRNLIRSEWYQSLWPEVRLVRAGEMSFENSQTGFREGSAFGSLTSKRGDRLCIDDPHSVLQAESDADRAATTMKFREGALDRINDQEASAIAIIMQRLHALDISGVILEQRMPYVHLMLPMEFDPKRVCRTKIGFKDPRTIEGELLDPARFPPKTIAQMKHDRTAYAWAGQFDQSPSPREGGMFKRHWFEGKVIAQSPPGTIWWRAWDLAATKNETAARTAGVKMGRAPDGKIIVAHTITEQEEGAAVSRIIKATAEMDGKAVSISLPQDPGQAGKVQKSQYGLLLQGWPIKIEPEKGDKEQRAQPFADQCELGNVYLLKGEWNSGYLDELCAFPTGRFKDQVDASSSAFARLVTRAPVYAQTGTFQRR